jgi:hypothetical protein
MDSMLERGTVCWREAQYVGESHSILDRGTLC